MTFFGPDLRNGLPIGLGSVAGFGIAPRFSPASLFTGGINGTWYDPSDSTTLFSDRAGTTPCGTPGGGSVVPVGRMLDKSGNGNHATAANDTTARPELRARVNLLTYSEQFDNAAWTKTRTTVSANTTATTDPLGGNTADKIIEGVFVGNDCSVDYSLFTYTASVSYTLSLYAKAAERTRVVIVWPIAALNNGVIVDLSAGTVVSSNGVFATTITNVGNGWWRIVLTVTSGNPVGSNIIRIGPTANTTSFATTLGYNGDGTSGIYLWGAQLTATNEFPANTYQRIVDANTYDAVGFPRYLACNGTSSAMSTPGNVNLSGTDKVTVFAGVRKLSDAAGAILAEFSQNAYGGNNGAFGIAAPVSASASYDFRSQGTNGVSATYTNSAVAAPITNVVTGVGNIGAPVATLRTNGAQVANSTGNQGSGNYGNYPLYIGARNNSSAWFTGNIYSLIVVGSAVSAGNISSTEQWVAGKTGITI